MRHRLKRGMMIAVAVAALITAVLPGCGGHSRYWQHLETASRIMDDEPDSALAIMQAIVPESLQGKEEKARYNLLMTYAMYKQGNILTSDSMLNIAADYYRHHKNSKEYMLTKFCEAEIAYNNNDHQKAMQANMESYDLAKKQKDHFFQAKNAEAMGYIFSLTHNFTEVEKYTGIAAEEYKLAEKERFHRFALADYANALFNTDQTEKSISLLDSLEVVATKEPVDSALANVVLNAKLLAYWTLNYQDSLVPYYEKLLQYSNPYDIDAFQSALMSIAAFRNKDFEKGHLFLDNARQLCKNSIDTTSVYFALSELHKANNDYEKSKLYTDSILHIQNAELKKAFYQPTTATQRDYYNEKVHYEQYRSKILTTTIIVTVMITIITVIIIVYVSRLKLRAKNSEIKRKNAELRSKMQYLELLEITLSQEKQQNLQLQDNLDQSKLSLKQLKEDIGSKEHGLEQLGSNISEFAMPYELSKNTLLLYGQSLTTLNMLCESFISLIDSDQSTRKSIISDINDNLTKLKSPRSIQEIRKSVNKYLNNILVKLEQECPFLTKEEILLVTFIYAGFNNKLICFIMNERQDNLSLKKRAILDKIKNSSAIHKNLFISKMKYTPKPRNKNISKQT